MRLIRKQFFLNVILPKIGISYKVVNDRIKISGFYKMIKKFDL